MTDTIRSWSFSRLQVFEQCKRRAKLQYVDRIPDPQPRTAADRGTAIHQTGEDYVRGLTPSTEGFKHFLTELKKLRDLFADESVSLEEEWGYDRDWIPMPYNEAWLRVKLDALVWLSPTEAVVIDYKTGRKFGNEIKHGEQTMMYAAATAARYPEVEIIHTELWYLDQNELTRTRYSRSKALEALARYDRRGRAITEATVFPPNANMHSCKYCPYRPEPAGTGHCWCDRCKDIKPIKGARLVPKPDGIHGRWLCQSCLTKGIT